MTYAEQIVDLLLAESTLVTLLTGGIYIFEDSGRKGINRTQLKEAFSSVTGLAKPMSVVYEMQETPTGEAIDAPSGFMSTVTPVAIWIYDDGDAGYGTIDAAYNIMYSTLNFARLTGAFQILWGSTPKNRRESLLSNACYYDFNIRVHGYRTS